MSLLAAEKEVTERTWAICSRSVAYQIIPGQRRPTVVMVPGLHSYTNMKGMKASCLLRWNQISIHGSF